MHKKTTDDGQLSLFEPAEEKIIKQEYSDIMKQSYIDYAMSVIIARAVPDIRDGLKPVQRRILYDMGEELGLDYNKPYRKSARIVGDTMGKFHPHGDSSIYDAMVVMAQDFKREIPLVDGHGNFGSIEGDGAAAQRYTESRLQKITQENYLADLDKKVVDYVPNYDETEREPEVLPVKIPNFLINGSEGIAVGMTTSTPSHNLVEVLKAEEYLMDTPGASIEELMDFVKGPDFPTGGVVANSDDLLEIYKTGTGKIRVQGRVTHEKNRQVNRLVITEIPYTMIGAGIANFLNDVAMLVDSKQIPDIVDISNQSSKEGIKIVLDLKKNVSEEDAEKIKTILLSKTKLEDTFGVNMLAIANGRPETLTMKSALEYHISFLFEINTRKYTTMLAKEKEKAEVQEGLIKAIDVLDAVIETIRGSKTKAEAKECLMTGKVDNIKYRIAEDKKIAKTFDFTEMQADAILDMRLSRLIGLELEALKKENEKTKQNIEKYTKILSDKRYMKKVIKDDLEHIIKEYGQPRKTSIKNIEKAVIKKEAPKAFKEVVLMDKFGYVRAVSDTVYEKNKEAADSESKWVIPVMSDDKVVFITENGIMHTVPANKIPFGKFRDKSIPVDNVSTLDTTTDLILYAEAMSDMAGEAAGDTADETARNKNVYVIITNLGGVKKLPGAEFSVKSKNTKYIKLKDGEVCTDFVKVEKSEPEIVLVSEAGRFLRFSAADIPEKKRGAGTVAGIAMKDGEKLSDVFFVWPEDVKKVAGAGSEEAPAGENGGESLKNAGDDDAGSVNLMSEVIPTGGEEMPSGDGSAAKDDGMPVLPVEEQQPAELILTLKNKKQIPFSKLAKAKRGGKGTLKKI